LEEFETDKQEACTPEIAAPYFLAQQEDLIVAFEDFMILSAPPTFDPNG